MVVHELKILPEYYQAINEGIKTFEIRFNDRDYSVGDVLLLKENSGSEVCVLVKYITDYQQKDGYIVMSIELVPAVFEEYLQMTEKEKKVFQILITHRYLYGIDNFERDAINTYHKIMSELLGGLSLTNHDEQWFMELWDEEE